MLRVNWLLFLGSVLSLTVGEVDSHADVTATSRSDRHSRLAIIASPGGTADLNLPPHVAQRFRDRTLIDFYQTRNHRVVPGIIPTPKKLSPTTSRAAQPLRVVHPPLAASTLAYRRKHSEPVLPLRGFRAPILHHASADWATTLPTNRLSRAELDSAAIIEKRLASDGLLSTLSQVIERIGPAEIASDPRAGLARLQMLGFPTDLLHHFKLANSSAPTNPALAILSRIAQHLSRAAEADAIQADLNGIRFHFLPSSPDWAGGSPGTSRPHFQAATESGDQEVGLLRMQMGGGWHDGIVPGGSIDVINQMVEAFRTVDFLISVDDDLVDSVRWMATNSWRLRRKEQVTLTAEQFSPSAWAQDNGKAGWIQNAVNAPIQWATLVPRYASVGEGRSTYSPAESYVADGLRAAGQAVVHSPLLFQGGNLFVVREPGSGQRVLLMGEGELARNITLGLAREQILESFRREFGVDRVVVLPGVSYHLDFDLSIRQIDGELVIFVNDTPAAVRGILMPGIDTLERHGVLAMAEAARARASLVDKSGRVALSILQDALSRISAGSNIFPSSLSRMFVVDANDDAAGNLQTFLLALDLLSSEASGIQSAESPERLEYLRALRRMEDARLLQQEALKQLGWRVVAIPSMPDLLRSINYLNGIQHRAGLVMPVFGGFYASLDRSAMAAFQRCLGPNGRIVTIRSAECQRRYGGVHCTTVAYPRLTTPAP